MDMGYDYDKVDDFLEEKGLCELSFDLIIEGMESPNFRNPLYKKPVVEA